MDATLPFGLWLAPEIFTAVADGVKWIFVYHGHVAVARNAKITSQQWWSYEEVSESP